MRKTTAKYSGAIFLWLLMVSPVALVLAIEKKHPDFENYLEGWMVSGPLWHLAMFMREYWFSVIWAGAALVVLAICRWRRIAIMCRTLLGVMALASTGAALVVAARYEITYVVIDNRLAWWLHGAGIGSW